MKKFKSFLNEMFVDANNVSSDIEILRLAMTAELDAASLYDILAKKTADPKIKQILKSVKDEELAHVGEFEILLKGIDKEYEKNKLKGYKEVQDEIV